MNKFLSDSKECKKCSACLNLRKPSALLITFRAKLTLSSVTTVWKWSSLICLCERSVYHQFISLTDWKYSSRRMQHPVARRRGRRAAWAACVWMRYANHQSCIFISWHLLTFCGFLFIRVFRMHQINTVNMEKIKQTWETRMVLWCWRVDDHLNF